MCVVPRGVVHGGGGREHVYQLHCWDVRGGGGVDRVCFVPDQHVFGGGISVVCSVPGERAVGGRERGAGELLL